MVDGRAFLLWLHVGAMMLAFAGLPIAGIIFRVIVQHVDEQRVFQMLATAFSRIFAAGGISVGVGVVSGLLLAHAYGYASGWLVLSYVLSTMAALVGILIDEPWSRRLAAADLQTVTARPQRAVATTRRPARDRPLALHSLAYDYEAALMNAR